MSSRWLETHIGQVFVVRSRRSVHWALRKGAERAALGQRYTDLDIQGPKRKAKQLVDEIAVAARPYNAVVLHSNPEARRITLQFPPSRSEPPPPPRAGVREPREPLPDAPAGSAFIDE